MNQSLAFEQTTTFAPETRSRPAADHQAQSHLRVISQCKPANTDVAPFVERRQMDHQKAENAIRSPIVLGFAGLMGGLLLSAVLIVCVAFGLALSEVRWSAASQYCVTTVLIVFGAVGALLYWDTMYASAKFLSYIEPAVERRGDYLHLSSINAFENLRNLATWTPGIAVHGKPIARFPDLANTLQTRPATLIPHEAESKKEHAARAERRFADRLHGRKRLHPRHEVKADNDIGLWGMAGLGWSGVSDQSAQY